MSASFNQRTEEFTIICDECLDEDTFEAVSDWADGLAAAKRHGWRPVKTNDGSWIHCCKPCASAPPE